MVEMIHRGYSKQQVQAMYFPTALYDFPAGEGSFTGTLVMKMWNGKRALICYFDTDDGNMYKLCTWFSPDVNRTYRPAESDLDLSRVEIDSKLKVTYGQTKNGTSKWLDAEVLEDPTRRRRYNMLQLNHNALFGQFIAGNPDLDDVTDSDLKELERRVALGEALAHKTFLEDSRVWLPTLTDEERETLAHWEREWNAEHPQNEQNKDAWRKYLTTTELNFVDGLTDDVYPAQAVEGVGGGPHGND